jgi:tetratricopeptide (TPR) repeat protein
MRCAVLLALICPTEVAFASSLRVAWGHFQKGQLQQAEAQWNTLSPQVKQSSQGAWLRGHILYARKQYGQAAFAYERAMQSAPKHHRPWLLTNLGNAYFQQKKWTHAIRFYAKALQLDPTYERARFNLELALRKQTPPPPPPPPRRSKKRKPPPPPPPGQRKRKKKPKRQRTRGLKPNRKPPRMPKAKRIKLEPFDQFIPYWRLLRHRANQHRKKN